MKARSHSNNNQIIKGFNSRGYFHMVEPYCEQYLKAKHQTFEKSKKLREIRNKGKQNNPTMFDFEKPKSGFYLLKGCKLQSIGPSKQNQNTSRDNGAQQPRGKSEFLNYFLKKYAKRKEKQDKKQKSESLLPIVRIGQPYMFSNKPSQQGAHSQSVALDYGPLNSHQRLAVKKLKTQPIVQKRKNKSCVQLQKKQKTSTSHIASVYINLNA